MPTDEEIRVLDTLMDIFHAAHQRWFTLDEVTEKLRQKGIFTDKPFSAVKAKVNSEYLSQLRNTAHYPFLEIEIGENILWGLETWLPKGKRPSGPHVTIEKLLPGWETAHQTTEDEINTGKLILQRPKFESIAASLGKQRDEHMVALECYASEQILCILNTSEHCLQGEALQHWYMENRVQPADIIKLTVEDGNLFVLRIYTDWDRDADAYRRYVQRLDEANIRRTTLSVRDLIWLYFQREGKVAHRSEIAKAVLADRPEISEKSVDACLSANSYLFVRTGERGNWGLKEWGIDSIILNPPIEVQFKKPFETAKTVDIDSVLAEIHAGDWVYKALKSSDVSLAFSELADRISASLGIDARILRRTSFVNVQDERLIRRRDGTFDLLEKIEGTIASQRATITELEDNKSLLLRRNESLASQQTALEAKLAQTTQEVKEVLERAQETEGAPATVQNELENLKAQFACVESERDTALKRVQEVEEQNKQLRDQVSALAIRLAEVNGKLEIAMTALDETVKELHRKQAPKTKLEQEREDARNWARRFFSKSTDLEKRIQDLESERKEKSR